MWNVLEEDAVLLLWSGVLHRCMGGREEKQEQQRRVGAVHVRNSNCSRRKAASENAKRGANRNSMCQ